MGGLPSPPQEKDPANFSFHIWQGWKKVVIKNFWNILSCEDCNWHYEKIKFSVDLENTDKNTQFKIWFKSEDKLVLFSWKKRSLKTVKNETNLNTKWHILQNNQNADANLLHSHGAFQNTKINILLYFWKEIMRKSGNLNLLKKMYAWFVNFEFPGFKTTPILISYRNIQQNPVQNNAFGVP